MKRKRAWMIVLAGVAAGIVNGLFGAGGGMVLIPLLTASCQLTEEEIFPSSVSIILPICLVSLGFSAIQGNFPIKEAFPYLIGSAAGGALTGILGRKIPVLWLHRVLGGLILFGGIRYLCF